MIGRAFPPNLPQTAPWATGVQGKLFRMGVPPLEPRKIPDKKKQMTHDNKWWISTFSVANPMVAIQYNPPVAEFIILIQSEAVQATPKQ